MPLVYQKETYECIVELVQIVYYITQCSLQEFSGEISLLSEASVLFFYRTSGLLSS